MNTDNRLLTRESSEHIREFFSTVERLSVSMERLFAGRSPAMAGENFYTDRELAEKLKVSRRSLQQYRDSGLLAFTRLGGKILYRSSDIEKLLDGCYREAFHWMNDFIRNVPYGIVIKGAVGRHTGRPFVFFPSDERL